MKPEEQSLKMAPQHGVKVIIEPGRLAFFAAIREFWHYRELFFFLAWRDVSIKYKQTILGVLWMVLQPLVSTLVFTVVFFRLAHIPSENVPYPIFVLVGIIPWNFFAGSLSRAGESLVSSANLITKVYFPRLIIPGAAVLAWVVDYLISLVLLFFLMIYYKRPPGLEVIALPALTILVFFLSYGLSLFFAALNVRYRDAKFVLTYLVQVWMYVTPVVYPYSLISGRLRSVAMLNPMLGVVEGFRWMMLGRPFPRLELLSSCVITLMVFLVAQLYYNRTERAFADVV